MYFADFHTHKNWQLCLVRVQNICVSFNEWNHTVAIFHFFLHSNKNSIKSDDVIKNIHFLLYNLNLVKFECVYLFTFPFSYFLKYEN